MVETYSTIEKRAKRMPDFIVETTEQPHGQFQAILKVILTDIDLDINANPSNLYVSGYLFSNTLSKTRQSEFYCLLYS